jgi:hypothetical protein
MSPGGSHLSGTRMPRFPDEAIHSIIYENWKQALSFA